MENCKNIDKWNIIEIYILFINYGYMLLVLLYRKCIYMANNDE